MTISNIAKKLATFNTRLTQFKAVQKTEANTDLHAVCSDHLKTVERFKRRKTELTPAEQKEYSNALTNFDYRTKALVMGEKALEWLHAQGCTLTDMRRNTYGKDLKLVDLALGKSHHDYEQSNYASAFYMAFLDGDAIDSPMTVTAGDLAKLYTRDPSKPHGQTQPYAMLQALEQIGAGKRTMAGTGNWKQSKIVLEPTSAFIQAVNAINA